MSVTRAGPRPARVGERERPLAILLLCPLMHVVMHKRHGSHGGHGQGRNADAPTGGRDDGRRKQAQTGETSDTSSGGH